MTAKNSKTQIHIHLTESYMNVAWMVDRFFVTLYDNL